MTKKQFENLRVGDTCYLYDKRGYVTQSQILKIDRILGKVSALLLGDGRLYSYKKVRVTKRSENDFGSIVGLL